MAEPESSWLPSKTARGFFSTFMDYVFKGEDKDLRQAGIEVIHTKTRVKEDGQVVGRKLVRRDDVEMAVVAAPELPDELLKDVREASRLLGTNFGDEDYEDGNVGAVGASPSKAGSKPPPQSATSPRPAPKPAAASPSKPSPSAATNSTNKPKPKPKPADDDDDEYEYE